jgi:hypothetical protein
MKSSREVTNFLVTVKSCINYNQNFSVHFHFLFSLKDQRHLNSIATPCLVEFYGNKIQTNKQAGDRREQC